MRLINRQHFLNVLLRENKVFSVYNTLSYKFNDRVFVNGFDEENAEKDKAFLYFDYCFPNYLVPEFVDKSSLSFKLPSFVYKSYGIIIDDTFSSVEEYLKSNTSSNFRYLVRKNKLRLEQCFNIKYTVYFGKIDESTYNLIMSKAHDLLTLRFQQKNEPNEFLDQWDIYFNCLYSLINKKKASIFVVYNEDAPIQININFNINSTCFWYIPIYDIDYAKFSLGHIGIYNQLEWCLENNYSFLDLGIGTFDYKTKWSNYNYNLETQIVFNKKPKAWYFIGYLIKLLFKIKYIFIERKFKRINKKVAEMRKQAPVSKNIEIKEVKGYNGDDLSFISFEQIGNYQDLRKTLNDFLYLQKVHQNSIEVYKNSENMFFIKSGENMFKFDLLCD